MKSMTQVMENLVKPYINNEDAKIGLRIDQLTASKIGFDGTPISYTATKVQAAIEEADGKIESEKTRLTNEITTRAILGAHNYLYNKNSGTQTIGGLDITANADGSFFVGAGTATATAQLLLNVNGTSSWNQTLQEPLPIGDYYASCEGATDGVYLRVTVEPVTGAAQQEIAATDGSADYAIPCPLPRKTAAKIQVISGTVVPAGGITIKPLIRLATDPSKGIAPYSKNNVDLTGSALNEHENGAVNLLPNNKTTTTTSNVTFTVSDDGKITVNNTTQSPTATPVFTIWSGKFSELGLCGKTIKLSGKPSNSAGGVTFQIYNYDGNGGALVDTGSGIVGTITSDTSVSGNVAIVVYNGVAHSNEEYRPMITRADYPFSDYAHYVPYAKSNRELTEIKSSSSFSMTLGGITQQNTVHRVGNVCFMYFSFGNGTALSTATGADVLGTIPEGFRPLKYAPVITCEMRDDGAWATATHYVASLKIDTNGELSLLANKTNLNQCKYITAQCVWLCN